MIMISETALRKRSKKTWWKVTMIIMTTSKATVRLSVQTVKM